MKERHPGSSPANSFPVPDYRLLFEAAPGLYLVLNTDFVIVAVSDAYLRATMTRREEIVGRQIFDVFPDNPDDPAATGVRNLSASLRRVVQYGIPDAMAVQKYEIRRPDSEGGGFEERYWSPANYPVVGNDGKTAFIIHRVEDATEFVRVKQQGLEHERLAESLRSQGERMEAEIFHRAQEIQEANRKLWEIRNELELRVEDRTAALAQANAALRDEMEQSRRLEEQFRQVQKMEAIGRLAGGVAHDFNNLLMIILMVSSRLLEDPALPPSCRRYIEQVAAAGQRAATLTRQLLAFSRQQVLEPKVVDLNSVVQGIEKMLHRVIGEDIKLTVALDSSLEKVKVDRGQIDQVLMNLVVNARDAMPLGGTLTIETANVDLDETYSRSHMEVQPGRYVMLAVSDTGEGMDKTTQSRLFEPFFTTKEPGVGTGLGLATVFGIVKQSGGSIWVYSEPGHGSVFKIYLPVVEDHGAEERASDHRPSPTGTETILLVEDEPSVRQIITSTLKGLGYAVLSAGRGTEAIHLAEMHDGPVHLLISDVIMPEMGGRQVAASLHASRPNLKVLYISGYTNDAVVRHGIMHDEVAFLQKPFTPHSLARKVREVLGKP